MKFYLVFLILLCVRLAQPAQDESDCLYSNFKLLFSKEQQAFVFNLKKMINNQEGGMLQKWRDIDQHGDSVLEVWYNCEACPASPCRVPFLPELVRGSQLMKVKLEEMLTIAKGEATKKQLKKIEEEIGIALAHNKKALDC